MYFIQVLTLGILFFGKCAFGQDYSLCYGQTNGIQLPNSQDCASYFVCNHGVPQIFECKGGTLYDYKLKVCNWADRVTCGQVIAQPQPPIIPPFEPVEPIPPVILPEPQPPVIQPPEIEIPPTFDGIEFYPGIVELLSKPGVFACTHNGLYFAPHPTLCTKYFICENYKIHLHQCGAGIEWDYILEQCDNPQNGKCFYDTNQPKPPIIPPPPPPPPPPSNDDDDYEEIDLLPGIIVTTEQSTVGAVSPIEADPTIPPINIINPIPDCPGEQAFYPYAKDCHKYYICIGGIPILTSCPNKMVWDADVFQCNPEATTRCLTFEAARKLIEKN